VRSLTASQLINKTIEIYKNLESDTGQNVGWHPCGQLRIARTTSHMDEYLSYMNVAEAIGAEAALLSPQDVINLWPLLHDADGVLGALFHPRDGYVSPTDVTIAMAKGARDRGAKIHEGTKAVGFSQRPSGEWRVSTTDGEISCEHLVLATGNYARQTGKMLGIDIPAIPVVVQYWFTEPIPELRERKRQGLPELPIMRDEAFLGYTREEGDALMFGTYERPEDLELFAVNGVPDTYDGEPMPENFPAHAWGFERACEVIPALARAGIRANVRGPMQMTGDGMPLVGPAWGLRNVWLAEGVPGGILWGGAIGHVISEWIAEREPSIETWELDPRRFGDYATREWTKRKVIDVWGTHSDTYFPGEERMAGRPAKAAPSYDGLTEQGAVWGARNGWEIPNWYAVGGAAREADRSYRGSWHARLVKEEVQAVRENVGMIEITPMTKFEVMGPAAETYLDHILANRLPQVGEVAVCHHLNDRGGVKSDYTVARLAEDLFYLICPPRTERINFDELSRLLPEDGSVRLRNATTERGAFTIAGPRARDVLAAITELDLSSTAFPWMSVRTAEVSFACDVRILRHSHTGELAFELYHPIAYQRHLLKEILRVGATVGLRLVGIQALGSLRLDKSYRELHYDMNAEISALESGLDSHIALEKGNFLGKDAILAQRDRGLSRRLVTLAIETTVASVIAYEGVYLNDRLVGRITSGSWSFHLGHDIALALLPVELAKIGNEFEVPVLDRLCKARIVIDSPYDPGHERCRI